MPKYVYSAKFARPADDYLPESWPQNWTWPSVATGPWAPGWPETHTIYLYGGVTSSATKIKETISYDAASDVYTTALADMDVAVQDHASCAVEGLAYSFCGNLQGGGFDNDVDRYSPVDDSWTALSDASPGRDLAQAGASGGKAYLVGGRESGPTDMDDCDEYDPEAASWAAQADLPTTDRYGVPTTGLGLAIYCVGGRTVSTYYGNTDIFYPVAAGWFAGATLSPTRADGAILAMGPYIYSMGGEGSGGSNISNCDQYNPSTDAWAAKTSSNFARDGRAGSSSYSIYKFDNFVSGEAGSEAFDPYDNSWAAITKLGFVAGGAVNQIGVASI